MTEAERKKQEALKLTGSLGAAGLAIPVATMLPFANYLNDTSKIKKQEAMRMFPQADPNMFSVAKQNIVPFSNYLSDSHVIPLNQKEASSLVFEKYVDTRSPLNINNIYKGMQSFPAYLSAQPGASSSELGSYQQAISNAAMFPEGSIQALTVTPAPNPGRFAKDYAEVLADKLGKTINEREFVDQNFNPIEEFKDPLKLQSKIDTLTKKIPGTAGYVWGNIDRPQYSYAEGNWGLGQKEKGVNPSLYASRINADPTREADYLFTSNVLTGGGVDPRVKFKHYPDLGPATGPSYGIAPNEDISFRKDLIEARGELTTGDLQALLAERNLPFAYQSLKTIPDKTGTVRNKNPIGYTVKGYTETVNKPGDILRQNLERLAEAEKITTSQAVEKFARLVPNVGEPATPPTSAVTGRVGEFPVQGQAISPFGKFASKTDLRQIGILPPSDKATYSAFKVDEFDKLFNHVYPRYGASNIQQLDTYSTPVNPLDPFGKAEEGLDELVINRDVLRPQAANKLLNRTVANLVEQSKPIQGLGLGGLATGAVATAMDPAVIDALSRGDYGQAATTAAVNTGVGSAVGGATAKGLQLLRNAGYARPAAAIASALPVAGGVLAGLGAVETGKALNRAYRSQTGKDFVTRNQPASPNSTYTGPTPTIQPRTGTAILSGKPVQVPYGSVAGQRKVGRPWWDTAGSKFQGLLNSFSPIIGR
jgi:hypothetical protein